MCVTDRHDTCMTLAVKVMLNPNTTNFSETAGQILKYFHRNVPWVTVFKNCLRNFDLSINMALVIGVYLHDMDMKKFLKILLL